MDLQLKGNVAIITASSSGLGKASARALAEEGVKVVVNGRDKEKLFAAAEEIRESTGSSVLPVPGDIKNRKTLEKIVDKTLDRFGALDHLVTSAGGPPSGETLETDEEDWYEGFDLLVMSVFRLVKKAVPTLKKGGGGTIVNITSRSVKEALDSLVLSNSIRMSVIGLEKTLSRELAPEIRVNSILPGPHHTSRIDGLIEQAMERGEIDSRKQGIEEWSESVPLGRLGNPEELGSLVAFLSSPRASYINGAAISVDGGSSRSNL
ncbi:MAG: SDR family oxidoreductase [Candidatus Bipolaricaulota bacterium]|nr:SDR family oxidoreductase [Candidatus Bipolaricaulota bacterium]